MISKFLSITAAAFLATTVISHASGNDTPKLEVVSGSYKKDVDGLRSEGIVNDNYKSLVVSMIKKNECDDRTPTDFNKDLVRSDADAVHEATGISRTELMILAKNRATTVDGYFKRDERMGTIHKHCMTPNEQLINFSSFAYTKIPLDADTRQKAKELSLQIRDDAVDVITLRQAERDEKCELSAKQKQDMEIVRNYLERAISTHTFDADYVIYGGYSRDELRSVFNTRYPGLSECDAGKKIIEKLDSDDEPVKIDL